MDGDFTQRSDFNSGMAGTGTLGRKGRWGQYPEGPSVGLEARAPPWAVLILLQHQAPGTRGFCLSFESKAE